MYIAKDSQHEIWSKVGRTMLSDSEFKLLDPTLKAGYEDLESTNPENREIFCPSPKQAKQNKYPNNKMQGTWQDGLEAIPVDNEEEFPEIAKHPYPPRSKATGPGIYGAKEFELVGVTGNAGYVGTIVGNPAPIVIEGNVPEQDELEPVHDVPQDGPVEPSHTITFDTHELTPPQGSPTDLPAHLIPPEFQSEGGMLEDNWEVEEDDGNI